MKVFSGFKPCASLLIDRDEICAVNDLFLKQRRAVFFPSFWNQAEVYLSDGGFAHGRIYNRGYGRFACGIVYDTCPDDVLVNSGTLAECGDALARIAAPDTVFLAGGVHGYTCVDSTFFHAVAALPCVRWAAVTAGGALFVFDDGGVAYLGRISRIQGDKTLAEGAYAGDVWFFHSYRDAVLWLSGVDSVGFAWGECMRVIPDELDTSVSCFLDLRRLWNKGAA